MKNLFSLISIVCIAFACTTGVTSLMRFQDRELLIHPDKPVLAYPHKVTECVDRPWALRWLGKKCYKEQEIDLYDLKDKATRDKLINSGFTCKSKMRFKY